MVFTVHDSAEIQAPLDRVWSLSTRVELVQQTLGMRLVGGVTSGHVEEGSRVVWSGWKFGLPTTHHTLITAFEAPSDQGQGRRAYFQDSQERGRFATFHHNHWLSEHLDDAGRTVTRLADEVNFSLPFGGFGAVASRTLVQPHVRRLLGQRFATLRSLAEGDGWREWM